MFVNFNILNQLGSPAINSNTFANRPAAGQTGRLFVSTDTFEIYRDNGTSWDLIGGPGSSTVTGTGASGQVTYWTGASTIAGNNNLFWDIANSRLGIGTTTPGHKLQINGTGTLLSLNGGSDTYMLFAGNGADQYQIGYTDNALDYRRFSIYDSTGAKEVLTIDKQSRNVGINYQYSSLADQPAYTFDVSGSIRSTDSTFLATNGTSQVGINTVSPVATALIQANKTDGYGLYLNYTTNAGSGTTATALWAINTTAGSGFAAVIEEKTPNTTGGQYPLAIKHSLSSGTAAAGMGTGLHFQLPDDLGNFKTTQLTVETTDASNATYTTRYRFMAQVNNISTPLAYLTSVGLGIGNVIPAYKLDVNGTVRAFGVGNTGNFLAVDTNPGGASVQLNPQYGTGLPILYTNGGFPLLFGTNNTENMRLTTAGNFGVGLINPSYRIHAVVDNSYSTLVIAATSLNGNVTGGLTFGGIYNSDSLNFYSGGSFTTKMVLNNSGNLGLGVTPAAWASIFKVMQTGSVTAVWDVSAVAGFSNNLYNDGASRYITNNFATIFQHWNGGFAWLQAPSGTAGNVITFTQAMTLDASGSLLLGNTNSGNNILRIQQKTSGNTYGVRLDNADNTAGVNLYMGSGGSGVFGIARTAADNFVINALGLVGIGTNAPVTNLDVNAAIAGAYTTSSSQAVTRLYNVTNAGGINSSVISFQASTDGGSSNPVARVGVVGESAGSNNGSLVMLTRDGTGVTEKARINSSGNFGLKVTPNPWTAVHTVFQFGAVGSLETDNTAVALSNNRYFDGANRYSQNGFASIYVQETGRHIWYNAASGIAGNTISFTAAATLNQNGNFLIGTTTDAGYRLNVQGLSTILTTDGNSYSHILQGLKTDGGTAPVVIQNTGTTTSSDNAPGLIVNKFNSTTTSDQRFIQFYSGNIGTAMGGIVGNGANNVQFATLSDIREKENINSIQGSLQKILQLNPVSFDWKKNKEHVKAGFIAQEVENIFPEFVIENFTESKTDPRKGLTGGMTSGIIAHLIKAIQELQEQINELKK